MKANALFSTFHRGTAKKKKNISRAKFQSMIKDEKGVERLKLDDPRVDWGDDNDYHNVETLKIGNVRVPDQYFHLVSDPAGTLKLFFFIYFSFLFVLIII